MGLFFCVGLLVNLNRAPCKECFLWPFGWLHCVAKSPAPLTGDSILNKCDLRIWRCGFCLAACTCEGCWVCLRCLLCAPWTAAMNRFVGSADSGLRLPTSGHCGTAWFTVAGHAEACGNGCAVCHQCRRHCPFSHWSVWLQTYTVPAHMRHLSLELTLRKCGMQGSVVQAPFPCRTCSSQTTPGTQCSRQLEVRLAQGSRQFEDEC